MADEARWLEATLSARIADDAVLAAMVSVPRELFVPAPLRARAFENCALPIGHGQTISQPLVVARMAELLRLTATDRVLDVGTGSGYHAAVLARLAAHVWTVERIKELAAAAKATLAQAGVTNVTCIAGDGMRSLHGLAPFDAINVAAAATDASLDRLANQLAPGGRLIAPLYTRGGQALVLGTRSHGSGTVDWTVLEPVRFVPLVSAAGRVI